MSKKTLQTLSLSLSQYQHTSIRGRHRVIDLLAHNNILQNHIYLVACFKYSLLLPSKNLKNASKRRKTVDFAYKYRIHNNNTYIFGIVSLCLLLLFVLTDVKIHLTLKNIYIYIYTKKIIKFNDILYYCESSFVCVTLPVSSPLRRSLRNIRI